MSWWKGWGRDGERGSGAERKKEEIPGVTLPGGMDPLLLSLAVGNAGSRGSRGVRETDAC